MSEIPADLFAAALATAAGAALGGSPGAVRR
jgi:hypothetical protein